jgi:ATP-binding cassette subfamily C protein
LENKQFTSKTLQEQARASKEAFEFGLRALRGISRRGTSGALSDSYLQIASTNRGAPDEGAIVMGVVCGYMKLKKPESLDSLSIRPLALSGDWWKHSGLIMVCQRKSQNGDHHPVALLPRVKGYEIFDPTTLTRAKVTEEIAEALGDEAFAVYRPLPREKLSLKDLLHYALAMDRMEWLSVLAVGVVSGALGLLTPEMNGIVFSELVPQANDAQLWVFIALFGCVAIVSALLSMMTQLSLLRIESRIGHDLEAALWERIMNFPAGFFRTTTSGELNSRAMGFSTFWQTTCPSINTVVASVPMGVFYLAQIFWYDWKLALVSLVILLFFGVLFAILGEMMTRKQSVILDISNKLNGVVVNFITGLAKIRVAGAEEKVFSQWALKFARQKTFTYSLERVMAVNSTLSGVAPLAASIGIFYWLCFQTMESDDSVYTMASFVRFWSAYGLLQSSVLSVVSAVIGIRSSIPYMEKLRPILEQEPEVPESKELPGVLRGEIKMRDVGFRYGPDTPLLFDRLNISVAPGEFVAIVGPSGAGKSTLLRLLLGFETPSEGGIFYDNKSVFNLDMRKVRMQIGVVLQGGGLLAGSIHSNILCSREASDEEVWEAAENAGIKDDIESMPMGMNTGIMEGAGTISGGQRQRIIIARAFLGRPRMLFFDEPTSALDNRTQSIVMDSLSKMTGSTRIIIAHRLSTIKDADRIIVIDKGRVEEEGTFETLMSARGLFYELNTRQMVEE